MKENLEKKDIDVIKSSPLEEKIELEKTKESFWGEIKDKESGHFYIEKELENENTSRQNIEVERFVSLLSKGILHVSDIVEKDGKYYSRMNYELQENFEPAKKGEIEAELFILRYLFGDWDKSATDTDIQDNIYTKEGHFAHFDYGEAFRNLPKPYSFLFKEKENPKDFKDQINLLLNEPILIDAKGDYYKHEIGLGQISSMAGFFRNIAPKESIEKELLEKVVELEKAIKLPLKDTEDKDFFNAVIEKAKLDLSNERFSFLLCKTQKEKIEELRNILLGRLEVLKEVLLNRKANN